MICDRCKKKKICWTYKDKPPKECSRFRPFTHFDRIKAMSVEEMADFFVFFSKEQVKSLRNIEIVDINEKDFKCALVNWLESEVQENGG